MLHYQSWKGCQKDCHLTFLLFLMLSWLLVGCGDGANQKRDITIEAFSALKTPIFEMNPAEIHSALRRMGEGVKDSLSPEGFTAQYYRDGGAMLWLGRQGVTAMADTLLRQLHQIRRMGLSDAYFKAKEIDEDLMRFKALDFDQQHSVNDVVARLEYRLTRAYLVYVAGQYYGFVNPKKAHNRMEEKVDAAGNVKKQYMLLYDVPVKRPTSAFYVQALRKIENDSVGNMMREVEPQTAMYHQLLRQLDDSMSESGRKRVLVNMERCRWREETPMPVSVKRVVINIPAFMLYAYGADSTIEMRIGCGRTTMRTPLLTSKIEYIQINPEWNIPQSIIDNEVSEHAGDSSYFARNHYYIAERSTGKKVPISSVSRAMLTSGNYRVAQDRGQGNSLGRIIFRFKNNHAVYLHDTSSPAAFNNSVRAVSHGCVRVQRPFDLACYLLEGVDDWTLDKIRISMDIPPETTQGKDYIRTHEPEESEDGRRLPFSLVSYMPVEPHVPIYITYYTLYPDVNGQIQTYPDVYGYDRYVWEYLEKYT